MRKFALALLRNAKPSLHSHVFKVRGHPVSCLLLRTLAGESSYKLASPEDGEVGASKHIVLSDISMGDLEIRETPQKKSRKLKADNIDCVKQDFTGADVLHVEISTVKAKTGAKARSKAREKAKASEKAEERASANAEELNHIVAGEKATELTEIRVSNAERCSTEIGVINDVTVYEYEQAECNAATGKAGKAASHAKTNEDIIRVHEAISNYAAVLELNTYKNGRQWAETAGKLLDYGIPLVHVIKMLGKCKNLACTRSRVESSLQHFSMLGMSCEEMGRAVSQWPTILNISDSMFQRKVEFFESVGIGRDALGKIVCLAPLAITYSLVALKRFWDFWDNYMQGVQANAFRTMIVKHPKLLSYGIDKSIIPKIAYFEEQGCDKKMLLKYSTILGMSLESFADKNKLLEQFGMSNPRKRCLGIAVLRGIGNPSLHARLSNLLALGFSLDQVQQVISKSPQVLCLSEDYINVKLRYATDVMNLSLDVLVACPTYWTHNFERRIKYRYEVIQKLVTSGALKKEVSPAYMVCMTDAYFTKNFVKKLQDCAEHPAAPSV